MLEFGYNGECHTVNRYVEKVTSNDIPKEGKSDKKKDEIAFWKACAVGSITAGNAFNKFDNSVYKSACSVADLMLIEYKSRFK